MASHAYRVPFLHKGIAHKKFQLKIPTLSKNDCSATWKQNTNQKNFPRYHLRNVQRYQKYVPIFRAFFLTVSYQSKPTVCCQWIWINPLITFYNHFLGCPFFLLHPVCKGCNIKNGPLSITNCHAKGPILYVTPCRIPHLSFCSPRLFLFFLHLLIINMTTIIPVCKFPGQWWRFPKPLGRSHDAWE